MLFAALFFLLAFLGLAGLFGLKYWELKSGRVLFASARERADARASHLKELLVAVRIDIAKLPPTALRIIRYLVHEGALALAALARIGERQAHRLADLASYKHRFERRETRSEFLKKVAERKSGREEGTQPFANGEDI